MAIDTILDAWGKGISAGCTRLLLTENPYPEGTKLAEVWAKAWHRGRELDRSLFEAGASKS